MAFSPRPVKAAGWQGDVIFQYYGGYPYFRTLPEIRPGVYVVSATILTGPYFVLRLPWTDEHDSVYYMLRDHLRALVETCGQNVSCWLDRISAEPEIDWPERIQLYSRLRLARLCAYFLSIEPVERIGNTYFVFELTESEWRKHKFNREVSVTDDLWLGNMIRLMTNGTPGQPMRQRE